jgi:hypothetical protein
VMQGQHFLLVVNTHKPPQRRMRCWQAAGVSAARQAVNAYPEGRAHAKNSSLEARFWPMADVRPQTMDVAGCRVGPGNFTPSRSQIRT